LGLPRLNKFINCAGGINMMGEDNDFPSQRTQRILVENNLINIAEPDAGNPGERKVFQIIRGPEYVTIKNNTAVSANNLSMMTLVDDQTSYPGTQKIGRLTFTDNIAPNGTNGLNGAGTSGTTTVLPQNCDASTYTKNVIIAGVDGEQNGAPATANFVPANVAAVGYTDTSGSFTANDYTLTGASPYHNAGTDGTDIGCDIAALNAAIAGVG